jgi:2-dehydro-3-deoxygluconokinase
MAPELSPTASVMAAVDLLTLGEFMVYLRSGWPLSTGGTLSMHVAESDVGAGVARLSHRVSWAGVLGADPTGRSAHE